MGTRKPFGSAVEDVPDVQAFDMMDTLDAVMTMSTISRQAWAEVMLAFAINESHDQGFEQVEVEACARKVIQEEWGGPYIPGRRELRELAQRRGKGGAS